MVGPSHPLAVSVDAPAARVRAVRTLTVDRSSPDVSNAATPPMRTRRAVTSMSATALEIALPRRASLPAGPNVATEATTTDAYVMRCGRTITAALAWTVATPRRIRVGVTTTPAVDLTATSPIGPDRALTVSVGVPT